MKRRQHSLHGSTTRRAASRVVQEKLSRERGSPTDGRRRRRKRKRR